MSEREFYRILVVEDDQDIRESIVEILEDEGHDVLVAANGAEALARLGSAPEKPHLILLDLMMPIMSGFQFREEQLKNPDYASIPIAVLTADGNARAKAEQLRAAGFVPKPLRIQALLDVVERVARTPSDASC